MNKWNIHSAETTGSASESVCMTRPMGFLKGGEVNELLESLGEVILTRKA